MLLKSNGRGLKTPKSIRVYQALFTYYLQGYYPGWTTRMDRMGRVASIEARGGARERERWQSAHSHHHRAAAAREGPEEYLPREATTSEQGIRGREGEGSFLAHHGTALPNTASQKILGRYEITVKGLSWSSTQLVPPDCSLLRLSVNSAE